MKRWMISPVKGVSYNKETGAITLDGEGVYLRPGLIKETASIFGFSTVSVQNSSRMTKRFMVVENIWEMQVGYIDQGGTLEYQKGFYLPVEKREIIQIPIVLIDDEVLII